MPIPCKSALIDWTKHENNPIPAALIPKGDYSKEALNDLPIPVRLVYPDKEVSVYNRAFTTYHLIPGSRFEAFVTDHHVPTTRPWKIRYNQIHVEDFIPHLKRWAKDYGCTVQYMVAHYICEKASDIPQIGALDTQEQLKVYLNTQLRPLRNIGIASTTRWRKDVEKEKVPIEEDEDKFNFVAIYVSAGQFATVFGAESIEPRSAAAVDHGADGLEPLSESDDDSGSIFTLEDL
jgi:hypothetical protein